MQNVWTRERMSLITVSHNQTERSFQTAPDSVARFDRETTRRLQLTTCQRTAVLCTCGWTLSRESESARARARERERERERV